MALCLLGKLSDVRRFRNPSALSAFVDVDLRHYESGKLLYHSIGQIKVASNPQAL